jgi:hypothetical protein
MDADRIVRKLRNPKVLAMTEGRWVDADTALEAANLIELLRSKIRELYRTSHGNQ